MSEVKKEKGINDNSELGEKDTSGSNGETNISDSAVKKPVPSLLDLDVRPPSLLSKAPFMGGPGIMSPPDYWGPTNRYGQPGMMDHMAGPQGYGTSPLMGYDEGEFFPPPLVVEASATPAGGEAAEDESCEMEEEKEIKKEKEIEIKKEKEIEIKTEKEIKKEKESSEEEGGSKKIPSLLDMNVGPPSSPLLHEEAAPPGSLVWRLQQMISRIQQCGAHYRINYMDILNNIMCAPDVYMPNNFIIRDIFEEKNKKKSVGEDEEVEESREEKRQQFQCDLFVADLLLATGEGETRASSKRNAYFIAVKTLQNAKSAWDIVNTHKRRVKFKHAVFDGSSILTQVGDVESNLPNVQEWRQKEGIHSVDEIVLVEPMEASEEKKGASGLLRFSADFNHMLIEYHFEMTNGKGTDKIRCNIFLENSEIGNGRGATRQAAKYSASQAAMETLKTTQYTVKLKKVDIPADSDEADFESAESIPTHEEQDSDVVCKRLQQCIGVEEEGNTINIEGFKDHFISICTLFGRKADYKDRIAGGLKDGLRKFLKQFSESDTKDCLMFSTQLTKRQRQIIMDIAKELSLRIHVRHCPSGIGLLVFRSLSGQELLETLQAVGGESSRYKLVPPGSQTDSNTTA